MKKRRTRIFTLMFIILVLVIIVLLLIFTRWKKDEAAWINGNVIYAQEVQKEMEAMRGQVLGESPDAANQPEVMEQWRQTALENCMRRQLIFQLAVREGLMETSDYKELIQLMEQENKKRMEADQKGEVVYGILKYTEETYFTYLLSNMTEKLITVLVEKELKFEESDLKAYYDENIIGEQLNSAYHSIVMYSGDKLETGLKEQLLMIKKELEDGKLPEDIETRENVSVTSMDVTKESRVAQRSLELGEKISSLKAGETSDVFEDGEQQILLYCASVTKESKITFDESREYTRKRYLEQKLEELLKQLRQTAEVSINKRVLEKIVP